MKTFVEFTDCFGKPIFIRVDSILSVSPGSREDESAICGGGFHTVKASPTEVMSRIQKALEINE